ncbi:Plastin-1 [Exaiptasia diaphana]|nr:Plastin-1 [Exaiptasia diaphana]
MERRELKRVRDEDLSEYKEAFKYFDKNGNGYIDKDELDLLLEKLNINIPRYKRETLKKEYGSTIDFDEFQDTGAAFLNMLTKRKVEHTGGTSHVSAQGTTHSFSKSEAVGFADWMNIHLAGDEDLKKHGYIPLDISSDSGALLRKVKDGVLLCKLINATVEGTIDDRVINITPDSTYAVHENQTLAINSAISIGCRIVNIGAEDLASGKPHLVLGLLWQIIRIGLFSHITISEVPGLLRLPEGSTTEEKENKLHQMTPEEILMMWVNYHLNNAGSPRRISNFGDDIEDSEIYSELLTRLAALCDITIKPTSHIPDKTTRADEILKNAKIMGCKRFITAKEILEGNEKLNLAFVANLFNTYPCLTEDGDDDDALYSQGTESELEETREEKTYRNWMNSLGANPFVNWIYNDLQDGHILMQLYDRIHPGIVDWSRVASRKDCAKPRGGNMNKIANCNYAVEIAVNQPFGFSLVGVQGQDINEGKHKLTLGLLGQMMKAYTLSILLQLESEGEGEVITDGKIIKMVNDKLKEFGKTSTIKDFKDSVIASSRPVIDLIDCIKERTVDYKLVYFGANDKEKMQNARYALSLARKIGAQIYALPEDLVECNAKMVMTVFVCLLACSYKYPGRTNKQNAKTRQARK